VWLLAQIHRTWLPVSHCGSESDSDSNSDSDDESAGPTTGEIRISVHILPEVRDTSEEIEIPIEAVNLIESVSSQAIRPQLCEFLEFQSVRDRLLVPIGGGSGGS